jgi:beta-lactamase class A
VRIIARGLFAFVVAAAARPCVSAAGAQPAQRAILAEHFRATLARLEREAPGVVGIQIVDLATGERYGVNDTLTFPQGSAIKIALLTEMFRQADAGQLSLDERLPVRASDQVGGSGVIASFGDGTSQLAVRDLAVLMIVLSDNTATNILIDKVGMERVNATMRDLGVGAIKLQRKMIRPREMAAGTENIATPAAAATLMTRIAKCDLPMAKERCAELRRILEIPKSGPLPASVPNGIRVAWKPGNVEGVSTAWGIVDLPGRPYVITVMVNYSIEADADQHIRRIGEATYGYFMRLARSTPYGARVP